MLGDFQLEVGSQHIGHAPYFAPAHGVRLAGDRKGSHSRSPDATGQKMSVNDATGLVSARSGLLTPWENSVMTRSVVANSVEMRQILLLHATCARHGTDIAGRVVCDENRLSCTARVLLHEAFVGMAVPGQETQQTVEERDVGASPQRYVQVRLLAGVAVRRGSSTTMRICVCRIRAFKRR